MDMKPANDPNTHVEGQLELLLAEFRAFRDDEFRSFRDDIRADVAALQSQTGERLATLETHVKSGITGNGQPSRLASVEKKLEGLKVKVSWIIGIGTGVSALSAVVIAIIWHR